MKPRKFSPKVNTCECHGIDIEQCPIQQAADNISLELEPFLNLQDTPHNYGADNGDHHSTKERT